MHMTIKETPLSLVKALKDWQHPADEAKLLDSDDHKDQTIHVYTDDTGLDREWHYSLEQNWHFTKNLN